MSKLLSTSVSPCSYVDSTTFSRPGEWQTRDGGHLEPDAYRKWAMGITNAIEQLKGQGALSAR
jgi:lysophospholipase L1-like esterase